MKFRGDVGIMPCCVSCCFNDNKVHPLENVLDIKEVSLDESYMLQDIQYSSAQVMDENDLMHVW